MRFRQTPVVVLVKYNVYSSHIYRIVDAFLAARDYIDLSGMISDKVMDPERYRQLTGSHLDNTFCQIFPSYMFLLNIKYTHTHRLAGLIHKACDLL